MFIAFAFFYNADGNFMFLALALKYLNPWPACRW
jgi:hypothetical protein